MMCPEQRELLGRERTVARRPEQIAGQANTVPDLDEERLALPAVVLLARVALIATELGDLRPVAAGREREPDEEEPGRHGP
jgi:hypothetical protein